MGNVGLEDLLWKSENNTSINHRGRKWKELAEQKHALIIMLQANGIIVLLLIGVGY